MTNYTVVVYDETGVEVSRLVVDVDRVARASNVMDMAAIDGPFALAELAILGASPEVCPYDCDSCRS